MADVALRPEDAAGGEPGLLVGDVLVRHPDLDGLDEAAELFAVEVPETDSVAPTWGTFWREPLAGAPVLPPSIRLWLPDEGGFLLRPLGMRGTALAREGLRPDALRRVAAPPRRLHAALHFPAPKLVSNELFIELRYAMSPSVLRWLDFEDIRDGVLRVFAVPDFEGDVRLVTVVDEQAVATIVANTSSTGLQRKRLLQFLHAAATSPPAARWPMTRDLAPAEEAAEPGGPLPGALFPHQRATVQWMQAIEGSGGGAGGPISLQVDPMEFAGTQLGSSYEVTLPHGGVIGHPPGSGKTRIVASLAATDEAAARASTLVLCPAHLCRQWAEEFELAGCSGSAKIMDYDRITNPEVGRRLAKQGTWRRLVVDEPQDCPSGDVWRGVQALSEELRAGGSPVWLLCGTAKSHLDSIGRLLLGHVGWHVASRQSEWRACPQLAHIIRTRFVADPPWACLPMPPLQVDSMPVVLRPRESADAAVASLAGFVLDGVMLLSFGAEAAFAAAQERDELLMQMGWLGSVGNALLPVTEHNLADWESTVVQRSQQKVDELAAEIARLEADEGRDAARYLFAGGDAALAPELQFLAGAAARVELPLGFEVRRPSPPEGEEDSGDEQGPPVPIVEDACAAEWNELLAARSFEGPLQDCSREGVAMPAAANARDYPLMGKVILLGAPPEGDFASAAQAAEAQGAVAVLFAPDREEARPFGYRHDQAPPRIPAVMVNRSFFAQLQVALVNRTANLMLRVLLTEKEGEADADMGQGLLSAFIAEDAVDDELSRQIRALREERERGERALRFARQMRVLLEQNEAHCPVCFQSGGEAEAFAVLPDCFHILCRACLDHNVGYSSIIACPLCRTNVARLDIVVFRAPGLGAGDSPVSPNPARGALPDVDRSADGAVVRDDEAPDAAGDRVAAEEPKFSPPPRTAAAEAGGAADARSPEPAAQAEGTDEAVAAATPASSLMTAWEHMPSKLQRLLELLRELLASGPEERVLVFTQWAVHVAYLQEVLQQHGVEALSLVGELSETMDALRRFGREGEPRVLLLSSQRHSSGINLQAARHVVIVHPYCTPTSYSRESISRSQMLAFEAQAVGRVRRYPQQKPVRIYRLFAAGTIEEDLYSLR